MSPVEATPKGSSAVTADGTSGFSAGFSPGFGYSAEPLVLDVTVGGEDSNSYVTLQEAWDYFRAHRTFLAIWDALSTEVQMARLIEGTRAIDRFDYTGAVVDVDQALEFPRYPTGASTRSEALTVFLFPTPTVIPDDVKRATYEMIMMLQNQGDSTTGEIDRDLSELDVYQTIKLKYAAAGGRNQYGKNVSAGGTVESIMQLLSPWIKSVGGSATFEIVK